MGQKISGVTDKQHISMLHSLRTSPLFFLQWGDKNSGLEMVASAIDSGRGIWLRSMRG